MTITITKRLEFDAGHRLLKHESKCKNVHGHRYAAEITVSGPELDSVGRVVDFSALKVLVGGWIDEHWDHGFIYQEGDCIRSFLEGSSTRDPSKSYSLPYPPTAENMVLHLAVVAQDLLRATALRVVRVRLFETPTCWADWTAP